MFSALVKKSTSFHGVSDQDVNMTQSASFIKVPQRVTVMTFPSDRLRSQMSVHLDLCMTTFVAHHMYFGNSTVQVWLTDD